MREIENYLKHDKATNVVKIGRLVEFLPTYTELFHVQQKVNIALENLKTLVKQDMEENYGDDESKPDITKIKEMITKIIAVKKFQDTMAVD